MSDYNQISSKRYSKKPKPNNTNSFRKQSFREDSKDLISKNKMKSGTSREAKNLRSHNSDNEEASYNNNSIAAISKTQKMGKMSDRQSII